MVLDTGVDTSWHYIHSHGTRHRVKKHTSNYSWCACHILPLLGGGWKYDKGGEDQGSDQFISFNSIQFQFKLDSGFFNSIQFQFKLDSESFNSIPIQFIFFQFQFNSIQFLCTVINKLIEYFKFNLNISLFAAQFRKYIIQDHNNSRINKSALVQVLG